MSEMKRKKRWPIALIVIAIVVIASAALIYSFREAPGKIPIAAVSSGTGDTIVVWNDSGGIHAQRLTSSGQSLWGESGLLIAGTSERSYQWISDGRGGAIFTWREPRVFNRDDPESYTAIPFYAQRLSEAGELLWGDGVLIGGSYDGLPEVIPDGTGGAIFAWNDYRPFMRGLHDDILTVQKLDAAGTPLWGDGGIVITASTPFHELTDEEKAAGIKGTYSRSWPTYDGEFAAVYDGSGGVIVVWEEELTPRTDAVYSQRFNERGEATWPERIKVADGGLSTAESDGAGGAVIRTLQRADAGEQFIAHISGDGEILSSRPYYLTTNEVIMNDGTGGFFTIRKERDPPTGPPTQGRTVLYVQREDADGRDLWPEIRVLDPGENELVTELEYIPDGTGGIIIVWRLSKDSAPVGGVMSQRIDADGALRWGESGTSVFTGPRIRYQAIGEVLGDGSGGVTIIAAVGTGALYGDMVYAQRLDAEGNRLWGDGIRIDR